MSVIKDDVQPQPVTSNEPAVFQRQPPPPPQQQKGGCGCWIPALLTLMVVGVLVVVGLFLPPINLWNRLFGTPYATLTAQANAIASDGLTLSVDQTDPGQNFGVALSASSVESFINGGPTDALATIRAATPPNLALQSPVYTIETTGSAPEAITLNISTPAGITNTDLLSMYGWDATRGQWRFLPSQVSEGSMLATIEDVPQYVALFQVAPPVQPTVLVTVDVIQTLTADVSQLATIVSPAGLQPTLQGTLTGSLAAGFDLNAGYLVMPVIRNYTDPRALDPDTVTAILSNRSLRQEHVTHIVSFASTGFNGVLVDYRDIPTEQRDNFTTFITELATSLHSVGLTVGVVVPTAENTDGTWQTGAYDWRALGQQVDLVQINLSNDPNAYTPGREQPVEAMLRWAIGEVDRTKLLAGLSVQSVREIGGSFAPIGYAEALAGLGDVEIDVDTTEAGTILPGTELRAQLNGLRATTITQTDIQSPVIEYRDSSDSALSKVWLTTGNALRFRLDRTSPLGLAGVAFTDLLTSDLAADLLPAIMNYKLQVPSMLTEQNLALRWRIQSANTIVAEQITGLDEPLIVTLEAPDGNYAVNVDVVDGSGEVPRNGVAVALFAPTQTPTPLPTATPTPSPTPTPVVVAQAPVVTAPQSPANAPVAGSIVAGNFEYGGHVTSTNSERAAAAMRSAGMTWMKVQVRYSLGQSGDSVAGVINDAKARGFKVLIAVVGNPGELAAGGTGYMDQFAGFLAGVAAQGPDAIEVWNEPNLDREWPRDQISGSMYTQMLSRAYQAIKGANGGVMVISGAPAPTGAEAAYPGQVVNDDNWIRQMLDAGGLQYMDCLGAHYNEGIISPTQRSGDPRDGYYTRYFYGMLDTYWNLIGGQKPICFTELGYLTSAGYPPLPSFFAWAENVSLEQQAAWLAEAAALASQSGRVRLMIVWNVDFTVYGSDPQAGYAMIRADGSCPACNAMAAAR